MLKNIFRKDTTPPAQLPQSRDMREEFAELMNPIGVGEDDFARMARHRVRANMLENVLPFVQLGQPDMMELAEVIFKKAIDYSGYDSEAMRKRMDMILKQLLEVKPDFGMKMVEYAVADGGLAAQNMRYVAAKHLTTCIKADPEKGFAFIKQQAAEGNSAVISAFIGQAHITAAQDEGAYDQVIGVIDELAEYDKRKKWSSLNCNVYNPGSSDNQTRFSIMWVRLAELDAQKMGENFIRIMAEKPAILKMIDSHVFVGRAGLAADIERENRQKEYGYGQDLSSLSGETALQIAEEIVQRSLTDVDVACESEYVLTDLVANAKALADSDAENAVDRAFTLQETIINKNGISHYSREYCMRGVEEMCDHDKVRANTLLNKLRADIRRFHGVPDPALDNVVQLKF